MNLNPPAAPIPVPHSVPIVPVTPVIGGNSTPNNTIYINNLNEKIKRDDLKKSLYAVFVQFGKIMDILTAKNLKMKGQAFIVFEEISHASTALRAMQGFPLYEKPMRIQFARKDSDVIAKKKGTFQPRLFQVSIKPENPNDLNHQLINDGSTVGLSARAIRRRQAKVVAAINSNSHPMPAQILPQVQSVAASIAPQNNHTTSAPLQSIHAPINPANIPDQPPNKILFLTNLPSDANESMIQLLFEQFVGFKEVRMVPGRNDIAFVEFSSEVESASAKHGLQGFNIRPNQPIRITFAKK